MSIEKISLHFYVLLIISFAHIFCIHFACISVPHNTTIRYISPVRKQGSKHHNVALIQSTSQLSTKERDDIVPPRNSPQQESRGRPDDDPHQDQNEGVYHSPERSDGSHKSSVCNLRKLSSTNQRKKGHTPGRGRRWHWKHGNSEKKKLEDGSGVSGCISSQSSSPLSIRRLGIAHSAFYRSDNSSCNNSGQNSSGEGSDVDDDAALDDNVDRGSLGEKSGKGTISSSCTIPTTVTTTEGTGNNHHPFGRLGSKWIEALSAWGNKTRKCS